MRVPRVLDLGCGPNKTSGAIGVDHRPFPGVDVVWDLDRVPYPFADGAVDEVIFRHSLEHLADPLGAVKEAARVLRDGGRLRIDTPHFSSMNAYADMTHRHAFAFHAFRALATGQEVSGRELATAGYAFRVVHGRFSFWRLHEAVAFVPYRWIGIQWIANRFPVFYERFLAFRFPASEFTITLEVRKTPA